MAEAFLSLFKMAAGMVWIAGIMFLAERYEWDGIATFMANVPGVAVFLIGGAHAFMDLTDPS